MQSASNRPLQRFEFYVLSLIFLLNGNNTKQNPGSILRNKYRASNTQYIWTNHPSQLQPTCGVYPIGFRIVRQHYLLPGPVEAIRAICILSNALTLKDRSIFLF